MVTPKLPVEGETFFALVPAAPLREFILVCKGRVKEAVGPQRYLEDSPHLTLGLGHYADGEGLDQAVRGCLGSLRPSLGLEGWHTFFEDPMTGGHTLVLRPASEDRDRLRGFQVELLDRVSRFRTRPVSDRYADRRRFTPAMNACLDRYGFPFVGEVWEPHFTVASLAPEVYREAREKVSSIPAPKEAPLAALTLYGLSKSGFVAIRNWPMGELGS